MLPAKLELAQEKIVFLEEENKRLNADSQAAFVLERTYRDLKDKIIASREILSCDDSPLEVYKEVLEAVLLSALYKCEDMESDLRERFTPPEQDVPF
jgi:hypothetical protein